MREPARTTLLAEPSSRPDRPFLDARLPLYFLLYIIQSGVARVHHLVRMENPVAALLIDLSKNAQLGVGGQEVTPRRSAMLFTFATGRPGLSHSRSMRQEVAGDGMGTGRDGTESPVSALRAGRVSTREATREATREVLF